MIKLKDTKLAQSGARGTAIRIPVIYTDDNNLKVKDGISIFRSVINGIDSLIIQPQKILRNISQSAKEVNTQN